jgi:hypothetical protein
MILKNDVRIYSHLVLLVLLTKYPAENTTIAVLKIKKIIQTKLIAAADSFRMKNQLT